jgi:hypothetical protein
MVNYLITGNIYGEEIEIYPYETEKMLAFDLFLDFHMISKMYKEDIKVFKSGNKDPKYNWNYTMTNLTPREHYSFW